jgi:hypothetical protein
VNPKGQVKYDFSKILRILGAEFTKGFNFKQRLTTEYTVSGPADKLGHHEALKQITCRGKKRHVSNSKTLFVNSALEVLLGRGLGRRSA